MERPRTQIMFDIYDSWSGCICHDTRDSQWEQASVTYRMLCASTAETWEPQTCHDSRIHHPYSFYTLFFTVKQNACRESQLTMSIVFHLFFFSSQVWSRESLWDLVSLWNRPYNRQVCSLTVWSNHLVCIQRIIRLKIGWNGLHVCGLPWF